jgi:TPR repeat protein
MSSASPWGNPEPNGPRQRRPSPLQLVVLLALPLLGYLGGGYLERHPIDTAQSRFGIAVRALNSGYDRTALMLFRPMAEKGDARAQYYLASMYEHGWGVSKDTSRAVALYSDAAKQGFVPAEARLGDIYLRGRLVLQDLAKARQWSENAAKAGSVDAQLELARIYHRGLGAPEDQMQAYAWDAIAAARGSGLAARERDQILTGLAPENQAKAEALASTLEASLKPPAASTSPTPRA